MSTDPHAAQYESNKPAGVFRFAPKNPLTLEDVSAILAAFVLSEKAVLSQDAVSKLGPTIRHFEKVV